jgi:hypothetical protein
VNPQWIKPPRLNQCNFMEIFTDIYVPTEQGEEGQLLTAGKDRTDVNPIPQWLPSGTTGQILTSQGEKQKPQWVDLQSALNSSGLYPHCYFEGTTIFKYLASVYSDSGRYTRYSWTPPFPMIVGRNINLSFSVMKNVKVYVWVVYKDKNQLMIADNVTNTTQQTFTPTQDVLELRVQIELTNTSNEAYVYLLGEMKTEWAPMT